VTDFHTQKEGFVLKTMEMRGNCGAYGGSQINWRNAFDAFSCSFGKYFISVGQLLIGDIEVDEETDLRTTMECLWLLLSTLNVKTFCDGVQDCRSFNAPMNPIKYK